MSRIVSLVVNGITVEEIVEEYPDLGPRDIQQALRYAASAAEDSEEGSSLLIRALCMFNLGGARLDFQSQRE